VAIDHTHEAEAVELPGGLLPQLGHTAAAFVGAVDPTHSLAVQHHTLSTFFGTHLPHSRGENRTAAQAAHEPAAGPRHRAESPATSRARARSSRSPAPRISVSADPRKKLAATAQIEHLLTDAPEIVGP
jgi:hypothetical protein